jgi:hypothetical protein
MPLPRRWLSRAEIAALLSSACLFVLTRFDPTWIARWFGESPN